MKEQVTKLHHHFTSMDCKPFQLGRDYSMDEMDQMMKMTGIQINPKIMRELVQVTGMDNIQQTVTTATIPSLLQFLQNWLPGQVGVVTAARKIDDLVGISVAGRWEDEQIVQEVIELTGTPVPYGDTSVIPFANWNMNYVQRNVVRFEQGMQVNTLEEARSSRVNVSSGDQKRKSCGMQLEIARNAIGFYGYNSGNNLTHGFLTDPNLPNYVTVAQGAVSGSRLWSAKTFLEIQADILTAIQALRTQSKEVIDPNKTPLTLAVAANSVDYLSKTSDFGISVMAWMNAAYPKITVKSATQLNNANASANVFYLYAESVDDGLSTDDMRTFIQVVPSRFNLIGIEKGAKGYAEDYSNATAGVMVKRPFAVYRVTGI